MTLGQELVPLKLRRMYVRVAEQEARANAKPTASGVIVMHQPVKRPHAVQPAAGMTGK